MNNPQKPDDAATKIEAHNLATQRFIDLANQMVGDGLERQLVSAALMSASGIYSTYIAAGNEGFLQSSGVDRVSEIFRRNLAYIQERKKEELTAKGLYKPEAAAES